MATLDKRLTKSILDALVVEPDHDQTFYWDAELKGFGVRVSSSGVKSYVVKRGTVRVVIERTNVISLDEARLRAMEALSAMGRGENPIANRRARAEAVAAAKRDDLTVRQVWVEYRKAKKSLRQKTVLEYDYALHKYCGDWLDRPLRHLSRSFIVAEHTRIRELVARSKRSRLTTGNSTANNVMRLTRALWNFAESNEVVRDLGKNPVQSLSRNRAWYPELPREQFIPESHLPVFYAAINGFRSKYLDDSWAYRDLVRLMLFTGLRLGESMRLRWDNVDLGARVIRLTADQTKSRRKLDLPMSDYVAALLNGRPRATEWVFPGERGHVSDPRNILREASRAIARAKEENDPTPYYYNPHSLRRTFVTVAESCDLSTYTLKALVNHSFGGDVTAGYIGRNDERLRIGAQRVTDRMKALCRPQLVLSRDNHAA